MNYKFQVGDLVKVRATDIGLVTDRQVGGKYAPLAHKYTILIGNDTTQTWGYELTKVRDSNEV